MAVVRKVYGNKQAEQQWVVPVGVASVAMEAWGGIGGADLQGSGLFQPIAIDARADLAAVYAAPPAWNGGTNCGSGPPGYVKGTLAVTPGTLYYIYVGGSGWNGVGSDPVRPYTGLVGDAGAGGNTLPGGYNGGGSGGKGYSYLNNHDFVISGSGGGGASDVRVGNNTLGSRILVAGGSGGAGGGWGSRNMTSAYLQFIPAGAFYPPALAPVVYAFNPTSPPYSAFATPYFIGGAGMAGYGGGGPGERGTNVALNALSGGVAAGGGTTSAGGAAGTDTDTSGVAGSAGTSGNGGNGGSAAATGTVAKHGGGGGGGGYFGGGGGGTGSQNEPGVQGAGGGGGGGANFIGGSFTNTINAAHVWPDLAGNAPEKGIFPDPLGEPIIVPSPAPYPPGGFVRLTYDQPPSAPTIVQPGASGRVPVGIDYDIKWLWSSPASADLPALGEGGAEITWTFSGVDTVTFVPPQSTGPAEGRVFKYTVPAGTLTAGRTYTVKVKVYDATGAVSPYSPTTSFRTVAAPTAPVITTPASGADLVASSFNVTWTNPNGAGTELLYRVVVLGLETGRLLDTGILHSGTRLNLSPDPVMKTDVANWVSPTNTKTQDVKADPWAVANSYKVVWTTKNSLSRAITTIPGVVYRFSGYFASAASTDPAMAMAAIDPTTGAVLAQGAAVAVAGTPGNWQRVDVTFAAVAGTTNLAFIPIGGSTTSSFFSSSMVEVGPQLGLYFGTATSKDPGVTGTITTTADGFQTVAGTDILTQNFTTWGSVAENVLVTVYLASLASVEYFASAVVAAQVNISPPGIPGVVLTKDDTAGWVALTMTAVDTPNTTVSLDVYRSVSGVAGTEIRLAHVTSIPVSRIIAFTDYTPGTDTLYQYRVRARSILGGFKDVL